MKKKFLIAGILGVAFIWLAVILRTVDVAPTGLEDTKIGLSTINMGVHNFFGVHKIWDQITDGFVAAAIAIAATYAVMGVVQLVKRKSIKKVDIELKLLAGLYAVMAFFYLLFEKVVVINYRPVFEDDGTLESSFPSTHTLAACVLLWSAAILVLKYRNKCWWRATLVVCCIAASLVISVGRIFAGVHWLTDVLGGYLLSGTLVLAFWGLIDYFNKMKHHHKKA